MTARTIRTTVTLPAELIEATDLAVQQGKAKSRNELVANALVHELTALREAEIDTAFAGMAEDRKYQAEARQVLAEFAQADWEALQTADTGPRKRRRR